MNFLELIDWSHSSWNAHGSTANHTWISIFLFLRKFSMLNTLLLACTWVTLFVTT